MLLKKKLILTETLNLIKTKLSAELIQVEIVRLYRQEEMTKYRNTENLKIKIKS